MAVRATRFAGPATLPAIPTLLFEVPTGVRWKLEALVLAPQLVVVAGDVSIFINGVGPGDAIVSRQNVPAGETMVIRDLVVLNPLDEIYGVNVGAQLITATFSGFQLDLA